MGYPGNKSPRDFWFPIARARRESLFANDDQQLATVGVYFSISDVEAELGILAEVMTLFKRQRNDFLPISRLPSEILVEIFNLLRHNEPYQVRVSQQENLQSLQGRYDLGWIKVSHVCQKWREVAIDHALLWTDVVYSSLSQPWREEMLRRSKLAPLSIQLLMPDDEAERNARTYFFQDLVSAHADHLIKAVIYGVKLHDCSAFMLSVMPALEYLHLEDHRSTCKVHLRSLVSSAPHLKSLVISGLTPTIFPHLKITPEFRHLTSLYFLYNKPSLGPSPPPSLSVQLSTLFGCMPVLESLKISISRPIEDEIDALSTINLPSSVSRITLSARGRAISSERSPTCNADQLFALSKHIIAPPTPNWCFMFRVPVPLTVLASIINHHVNYIPHALAFLRNSDDAVLQIGLFRNPFPHSRGPNPILQPDLMFLALSQETNIKNPCQTFSLEKVQDLSYDDEGEFKRETWLELFGKATKVRRLRVNGTPTTSLVELLRQFPLYGGGSPRFATGRAILFPELESLSILEHTPNIKAMKHSGLLDEEALLACVRARRAHGIPLRELKLPRRLLHADFVKRAKEEVAVVTLSLPSFW